MLAGGGGAEEVKRLLNFKDDDLRHLLEDRKLRVRTYLANAFTHLQSLSVVKAQVELFLKRVGVLIAAHADIAREQRRASLDNVDVHHARAEIEQGYGRCRGGLVV